MSATRERVLFVDVARAAAILFMIQGHTLHALLRPEYQQSALFGFWGYLRGLTSCTFLMLCGFSFSLATHRHWADYCAWSPRLRRRLTRVAMFLALGYAMRIPIRPLSRLGEVTTSQWAAFTAVDILHLVALTLAVLQAVAWLAGRRAPDLGTRTTRRLGAIALAGAIAIVLLTPPAWRLGSSWFIPLAARAYLSTATGSLFPLFPWAAYILFGAALGAWFSACDAQQAGRAGRTLLFLGGGMFWGGVLLHQVPLAPYGAIEFWTTSPNLFLIKAGSVLILLSAAAGLARLDIPRPRLLSVLSRESLTIYLVHICIIYGSIWNDGLIQRTGGQLDLLRTGGWAVALMASMSLLAWGWHECKVRSAYLSTAIRITIAGGLLYVIA